MNIKVDMTLWKHERNSLIDENFILINSYHVFKVPYNLYYSFSCDDNYI